MLLLGCILSIIIELLLAGEIGPNFAKRVILRTTSYTLICTPKSRMVIHAAIMTIHMVNHVN